MSQENIQRIAEILEQAAETHHKVYAITEGAHEDWALWYAHWLVHLSHLPDVLGTTPLESDLVYYLVKLDKDYTEETPEKSWQHYYARHMLLYFAGKNEE